MLKRSSRKYCDKKNSRIDIRINENEKLLLNYVSSRFGCSTSRYLYLMIKSAILPYEKQILNGDKTYADFKTVCDD